MDVKLALEIIKRRDTLNNKIYSIFEKRYLLRKRNINIIAKKEPAALLCANKLGLINLNSPLIDKSSSLLIKLIGDLKEGIK
jgi:hypothetical protein